MLGHPGAEVGAGRGRRRAGRRRAAATAEPPQAEPSASRASRSSLDDDRGQSPAMATSGRRTLPSSAGSMSTWMILASGAKALILPVTRSSKRLPEGDEEVGLLHGGDGGVVAVHARACPGTGGGESGKVPRPMRVVTTGMPVRSASSRRASAARAFRMPPPA